jgi:chemotaxis protein CheD
MSEKVKVGMADLNICKSPDSIITLGLGSCVGVILYDPVKHIAGMLHAMLPDSTAIRNNANRHKFVDSGMDDLLEMMLKAGADKKRMIAKLAGGAQMFAFGSDNEMGRIGDKNVLASKEKLASFGIPLLAEDTGLNYGRTVEFFPETGKYLIRAVGKEEKYI